MSILLLGARILPSWFIIGVLESSKEDLDDYVADRISDETGWLINSCEYNIISAE